MKISIDGMIRKYMVMQASMSNVKNLDHGTAEREGSELGRGSMHRSADEVVDCWQDLFISPLDDGG